MYMLNGVMMLPTRAIGYLIKTPVPGVRNSL